MDFLTVLTVLMTDAAGKLKNLAKQVKQARKEATTAVPNLASPSSIPCT